MFFFLRALFHFQSVHRPTSKHVSSLTCVMSCQSYLRRCVCTGEWVGVHFSSLFFKQPLWLVEMPPGLQTRMCVSQQTSIACHAITGPDSSDNILLCLSLVKCMANFIGNNIKFV